MKPRFSLLLVLVLIVAFMAGLGRLFALRFNQGDIYPRYSSLRNDPLGLKVWFEALQRVPGLWVERNVQPWEQRRSKLNADTLVITAGLSPRDRLFYGSGTEDDLLSQTEAGARLILALTSSASHDHDHDDTPDANDPNGLHEPNAPNDPNTPANVPWARHLDLSWSFSLDPCQDDGMALAQGPLQSTVTTPMTWFGRIALHPASSIWQTLATCAGKPVIVTRPWGRGRLVVLADSALLSNEALVLHRKTGLLTYLIGAQHHLIFDETHLGIHTSGGLAILARKYRLHGLALGLLLVLLLFVWSRAGQRSPAQPECDTSASWVQGRDLGQGLVSLLQRHIPERDLLAVCVQQWRAGKPTVKADQLKKIDEWVQQSRQPGLKEAQRVELYRNIVKILEHKGTL